MGTTATFILPVSTALSPRQMNHLSLDWCNLISTWVCPAYAVPSVLNAFSCTLKGKKPHF